MSGLNKAIIIGRLGKDPEHRAVSAQNNVTNFSIATSERWKDKQGEAQEKTEWHRIVAWGKLAEISQKYLSKGSQVYVEGKLQTRIWEDQQGQKKYTTEIVATNIQFLGAKQNSSNQSSDDIGNFDPPPTFDKDEEIPF